MCFAFCEVIMKTMLFVYFTKMAVAYTRILGFSDPCLNKTKVNLMIAFVVIYLIIYELKYVLLEPVGFAFVFLDSDK